MSETISKKNTATNRTERPPVVVVMGHIDHGKSKLLDYIRKTNIVEGEVGGITQHLSAYEVVHKTESGTEKKITFLDTPGHAAFEKMRYRGAEVADIAILIVSAEEGVKAQTLEAFRAIKASGVPFVVAINKIDKPTANIEKTKQGLSENEIYLEGMGGDVPFVAISAKEGTGVSELLDLVLLIAELEELTGDPHTLAEGVVIEAERDAKKGMTATLLIQNGILKKGMYVISENTSAPVRIMENFLGVNVDEASMGAPVRIIGFDTLPRAGAPFKTVLDKKEARAMASAYTEISNAKTSRGEQTNDEDIVTLPLIIKADVSGSLDALLGEVEKIQAEGVSVKIIHTGVGEITEGDVKMAGGKEETVIIGFHVDVLNSAREHAERLGMTIVTFDIIYKVTEYLEELVKKRTPKQRVSEITGKAKILRTFSTIKNRQVIGGKVIEGSLCVKGRIRIIRRDILIGEGVIRNLQQQKVNAKEVSEGEEFGAEVESKNSIAAGDILESFIIVEK